MTIYKTDNSKTHWRQRWTLFALILSLLIPSKAGAWGTEEHIAFGQQISQPFDEFIDGALPVRKAESGPQTFGDWVSAPDFARGLGLFLDSDGVGLGESCAALWTPQGVEGMETEDHDQSFADLTDLADVPSNVVKKAAFLDCADNWAVNNNHFGDFARTQYNYYHEQAMEAAQRYRASNNSMCRDLAYTLEGWGQHYLTDSTASGHAWNPPGRYFNGGLLGFLGQLVNLMTGVQTRMSIHNYLNEHGARMAAPHYHEGTYYGDTSKDHDPAGHSIPERPATMQWKATMSLARSGLGQIASAVECPAPIARGYLNKQSREANYFKSHFDAPLLDSSLEFNHNEVTSPRKFFASNETMCKAMQERPGFRLPTFIINAALEWGRLEDFIDDCSDDNVFDGVPGSIDKDGHEVASCFFAEAYSLDSCFEEDGGLAARVSDRDPQGDVDLDALGCPLPETPSIQVAGTDACGHELCEVPTRVDGSCGGGMKVSNGCCYPQLQLASTNERAVAFLPAAGWLQANSSSREIVQLKAPGQEPGDMSEFLWFADDQAPADYPDDVIWQDGQGDVVALDTFGQSRVMCSGGPDAVVLGTDEISCEGAFFQGCDYWGEAQGGEVEGESGQFVVYETRVSFPKTEAFEDLVLSLEVSHLDEGLKVQVDGHLVAYVQRSEMTDLDDRHDSFITRKISIPLLSTSAVSSQADGSHVIRLVHMNSCDEERALEVGLSLQSADLCKRCDGSGSGKRTDEGEYGCSTGGKSGGSAATLLLLALIGLRRRRHLLSPRARS